MKNFLALAMVALMVSCVAPVEQSDELVLTDFQANESAYPYKGGILITNFGTEPDGLNQEGKGYVEYYKDGVRSMFIPNDGKLNAPKGMMLVGSDLYICDVNKIVVYNLDNLSAEAREIYLPEGEMMLNDLVVCGETMYVSVTETGNIFKFNINNPEFELWANLKGANGLLLVDNVMYVACLFLDRAVTEDSVIYKITDLDNPNPVKASTLPGEWDGLVISDDGKTIYTTNWHPGRSGVYAMNVADGSVTRIETEREIFGPGDLAYLDGKLYIPDMLESTLVIKTVE